MARLHLSQINPSGSLTITGSLEVQGQTTLKQTNTADSALIVSGAMDIVQAQIQAEIQRAKLTIENLGSIGDREDSNEIDLGGFF